MWDVNIVIDGYSSLGVLDQSAAKLAQIAMKWDYRACDSTPLARLVLFGIMNAFLFLSLRSKYLLDVFQKFHFVQSFVEGKKRGPKPGSLGRTKDQAKVLASVFCSLRRVCVWQKQAPSVTLDSLHFIVSLSLQHLKKAAQVLVEVLCSLSQRHTHLTDLSNK